MADAVDIAAAPAMPRGESAHSFGADADAINARDRLGETLRQLRADAEGGWNRGVNSGRVNVRRFSAPVIDPETLFDRYTPDALADISIAAAVCVDLSGSMGSSARELSRAVWAIRHAADDADAELEVIGFGSESRVIADSLDRPTAAIPALTCADHSTIPLTAIERAYSFLRNADAKTKLFIILSDGSWEGDINRCEGLIMAMGEEGAETISIGFGMGARDVAHRARHFIHLQTLADLPRIFAAVVERAMGEGIAYR